MEDVTLQEFAEMCQQNTCPTCPMWRGTVNVPDNCCPVQMGMKAPEASAIVRRWQAESVAITIEVSFRKECHAFEGCDALSLLQNVFNSEK